MKRIKQVIKTFCEMPLPLRILIALLFALAVIFLFVMFGDDSGWIDLLEMGGKGETLRFIGIAMGGVLLAIQATVSYRRAKAMEDAAQAQADAAKAQAKAVEQQAEANKNTEEGQRQERFKNAIEHLGHERSSVRLGGAYELFHLARDIEELPQTVLEILCAHIRQTTRSEAYQKEYGEKPSEEIQSLLNLLFRQDHKVFYGCRINLQGSRLNGASLPQARLQKADLRNVQLREANLSEVQLQGADLRNAQLREAVINHAQLQGADLSEAQLREAVINHAQLQGADLSGAQLDHARLQEAKLLKARLQKANLSGAQLQGAKLGYARLQVANLDRAELQGANLFRARLQGAKLGYAQLQGAALLKAQLQEAMLDYARLQGADLSEARLQGAKLGYAQLQGADLTNAQLQGAKLGYAQLQGADLTNAQLQGAELSDAQLQGAKLWKAHLQEAALNHVQLQGIVSSGDNKRQQADTPPDFAERIRHRVDQDSEFSTVVFSGGLSEDEVNNMMKEMPDSESAGQLEEKLKLHIGEPVSHELPADSSTRTGTYTQEDAEQWIAEYQKAVDRDDAHP